MKLDYLRELYSQGLFSLHERFDSWEDAIQASTAPLLKKGFVKSEYGQSILNNVAEYGPYIFIAPHICMPHSKAVHLVYKSSICFMKVNQPVTYTPDASIFPAELFFCIAAAEPGEHLDFIELLMDIFDDEETMELLLSAQTEEEFKALLG